MGQYAGGLRLNIAWQWEECLFLKLIVGDFEFNEIQGNVIILPIIESAHEAAS